MSASNSTIDTILSTSTSENSLYSESIIHSTISLSFDSFDDDEEEDKGSL
jgi:hypothetical protein